MVCMVYIRVGLLIMFVCVCVYVTMSKTEKLENFFRGKTEKKHKQINVNKSPIDNNPPNR